MIKFPNLLGVLAGMGAQGVCIGAHAWQLSRRIDRAKSQRDRCLEACKTERPDRPSKR